MIHEYAKQCYLYMTDIVNQLAEEYNNDFCEWKEDEKFNWFFTYVNKLLNIVGHTCQICANVI